MVDGNVEGFLREYDFNQTNKTPWTPVNDQFKVTFDTRAQADEFVTQITNILGVKDCIV